MGFVGRVVDTRVFVVGEGYVRPDEDFFADPRVGREEGAFADARPVLQLQRHAHAAGDRLQVNHRIGGAADGSIDHDGIEEGLARREDGAEISA